MSERAFQRPVRMRPWEHGKWSLAPNLERRETSDNAVIRWIEERGATVMARLRLPAFRLRLFARAVERAGRSLEGFDGPAMSAEIATLSAAIRAEPTRSDLVAMSFALIREMTHRKLQMRHYPSQIMAGRVLHEGSVAQLATGEGKTITGLLPVITAALSGLPVHVVTVNPYLAERDCETLRPVIEAFGLSVGLINGEMSPDEKRSAYAQDVVFVTNKDLCFDYLRDIDARGKYQSHARQVLTRCGRDQAVTQGPRAMLRGLHFALLDEVDLILVDEARIPLVISGPREDTEDEVAYRLALEVARALTTPKDFKVDLARKSAELTKAGKAKVKDRVAYEPGLWRAERARVERIEQALAALHVYALGHDYIVMPDDEGEESIQIVDPHTGRVSPGRAWERGLHQLIELKEGVPMTGRSNTTAKITYQRFFRRYMKVAGMTGTGQGLAAEFWRVFGLRIHSIPTHRPVRRVDMAPQVYLRAQDREADVVDRALALQQGGSAVLVGTQSVERSNQIASALQARGGQAQVLNALQDAEEARIVALAGQESALTIATSMAGRGTDISLAPEVKAKGGLHVLLTEPSESKRVDLQLMGRSGRQGDPGRTETYVCLEDTLFQTHTPRFARAVAGVMRTFGLRRLRWGAARAVLAQAQATAERRNARLRRATIKSDRDITKMLGFAGHGE